MSNDKDNDKGSIKVDARGPIGYTGLRVDPEDDPNERPTGCWICNIRWIPYYIEGSKEPEKDTVFCSGCGKKILLLPEKIDGKDWVELG